MFKILMQITFFLLFTACDYRVVKDSPESNTVTPMEQKTSAPLTYSDVYNDVFKVYCIECHGNAGGINLETYDSTKAVIDDIQDAVFVEKFMPPPSSGAVAQADLDLLKNWIANGAPK